MPPSGSKPAIGAVNVYGHEELHLPLHRFELKLRRPIDCLTPDGYSRANDFASLEQSVTLRQRQAAHL